VTARPPLEERLRQRNEARQREREQHWKRIKDRAKAA
jgi:hypothetical protein